MNTKRIPGILLGVLILALVLWWAITPRTADVPEDQAPEDAATYETAEANEHGLQFEYRIDPDPYRMTGVGRTEDELTHFQYRYELMLASAYEELQASDEPREGPPMITITVYDNPDDLDPSEWDSSMGQFADLDIIMEEQDFVSVDGVEGTQYMADGLYVADVVWVASGGFLYRFAGEYIDDRDDIRDDFWFLIDSVQFTD